MVAKQELSKIVVTFLEEKEELTKIEVLFRELKLITGLKKAELYGKPLEWIGNNEIAKAKFIEHLMNEKAQEHQLFISK